MFKERIEERQKIRAEIASRDFGRREDILLLISESLDDYLEHRIETDKVIVGILKDIQGDIALMTDYDEIIKKLNGFFKENMD